ncbi:ribonuclease D [Halomonas sp. Bachu 37]|uniref:ribonuclease D n=1 Tax=Halomonas kashgarensis TaxID=3084920 RepID=UPI00321710DA
MPNVTPPAFCWIDTPDALDAACREVEHADVIALDTEFFREKTFYPLPALIQFAAGELAYLVDPLVTPCTEAFRRLLTQGPLKLLHASSEDLEVFTAWAGAVPMPLVDTQIAQGFLGDTPGMGYQRLVELWMGKVLPKEETRSNWLERPLSPAQCDYAALDVIYLLKVWRLQFAELEKLGRWEWLQQECEELVSQVGRNKVTDGQWYLRQRQLWRLKPRQIEAYRLLTTWREGEARRRDLPRNWLVSDKVLYAIAEALPTHRAALAEVEGVKPMLIKKQGDTILALVKQAVAQQEADLPPALPAPSGSAFKSRFKGIKSEVNAEAERLGMAPEMLLRRRDMEALVVADMEHKPLPLPSGWRGERLNEALQQVLQEAEA